MHTSPYYTLICEVYALIQKRERSTFHYMRLFYASCNNVCSFFFFITCFTQKLNNTTKTKYIVILIIAQHINKYYRWFLKHNMHKYMCNMLSGFAFTRPARRCMCPTRGVIYKYFSKVLSCFVYTRTYFELNTLRM